jgi:hypothetical protein
MHSQRLLLEVIGAAAAVITALATLIMAFRNRG